jgi:hypothetical protein
MKYCKRKLSSSQYAASLAYPEEQVVQFIWNSITEMSLEAANSIRVTQSEISHKW